MNGTDMARKVGIRAKIFFKKNPDPWSLQHTQAVKKIKAQIKQLHCLNLPNPQWHKIVETDASNLGYGGILKQYNLPRQ